MFCLDPTELLQYNGELPNEALNIHSKGAYNYDGIGYEISHVVQLGELILHHPRQAWRLFQQVRACLCNIIIWTLIGHNTMHRALLTPAITTLTNYACA